MGSAKDNLSDGYRENIVESQLKVAPAPDEGWLKSLLKAPPTPNEDYLNHFDQLHEESTPPFGYNMSENVFRCHAVCSRESVLAQMVEAYEQFPELPDSWLERLHEVRGWKKETCRALGLRKQTKYRDKHNGNLKNISTDYARIAIPVFNKHGNLQNIRLYKPDAKEAIIISWGKGTGVNRLFPWPEKGGSGTVWICEGEADTICARSLGLEAYTQTAQRKLWPDDQIEPFKDRDVVICYDADTPGFNYANAAADCLVAVARSVRIIKWPDFMRDEKGNYPEKHGQDLTDFIVIHKKSRQDLENLLPDAVEKHEEDIDTASQFFGPTLLRRHSFQPRLLAEWLLRDMVLLDEPMTGLLYRWNGQYYEPYELNSLKRRAIMVLGNESVKSRYEDAVGQAVLLSTIPEGRQINDQHDLLCLKNGMFDIRELRLLPHDKKYLSTIQINVEFDPKNPPECPRWQRFLEETVQTPEVIRQMQEFFGLCLTRDTSYDMCMIMIGDGGDGKSVSQKILRAMVGKENCTSISFDAFEDQFQRAMLYNKMVNLSSEVGGKAMDSEFFKRIVSGDSINASFKHKTPFDFEPFCKLVFAVNKMPKVLDTTDGLYRRLLPIHFKRQFLPGDPARDPLLEGKLMDELPGIFGWALEGLHRLRKRGTFNLKVQETQELLTDYRRQNSPVFTFVQDCCVFGDKKTHWTNKSDLYDAYRGWCGKNGFGAVHSQNFYDDLRRTVKTLKKSIADKRPDVNGKRPRGFSGILLVTTEFDA